MQNKPAPALNEALVTRWSTWAFDPTPLSDQEVELLLRAFQWAPSSNNRQPWRVVAVRGEAARSRLLPAFSTGNQAWAHRAPLMLVVTADPEASDVRHDNAYYAFDSGLACQNLMVQAADMGLASHPTIGWDAAKVRAALGIPEPIRVLTIIMVGRHGSREGLDEITQGKFGKRRARKPLAETVHTDAWGTPYQPLTPEADWEERMNQTKAATLVD